MSNASGAADRIIDKIRKIIASALMIGLVGAGTAAATALQQPDEAGIIVFSVTYIIFSNGILLWLVLGLIQKQRLSELCVSVGDVLFGPINDLLPDIFNPETKSRLKGTVGAMILVFGFLTVFISGILNSEVLSFLGNSYNIATRFLTLFYLRSLQLFWDGAPITVDILLKANNQGAGSLAAASAVLLGELIDAVGIGDPDEALQ